MARKNFIVLKNKKKVKNGKIITAKINPSSAVIIKILIFNCL